MIDLKDVRITIQAARVNAGMTQDDLAKMWGITATTVVAIEKGRSEPTMSQLRLLSEKSGIPMDMIYVPEKPSTGN